jgi:hypothetical protein
MGLYDSVECHFPLPDSEELSWPFGQTFQTKSMESRLGYYCISKDGLLTSYNNDPVDFSGVMVFYDSPTHTFENNDWAEYQAEFKGGQLVQIKRVRDNR